MALIKDVSKRTKIFCIVGSIFLVVMSVFHGSGYSYVEKAISNSNSESFLKEIVPILFAHPSIHLLGLAAFGILAIFLGREAQKVLLLLSLLIIADALLAFYLGAAIPGVLLLVAACCYLIGGKKSLKNDNS